VTIERYLRLVAGLVALASAALTHWVSPWFFLLTAFVGANLLQSAFTRWCPLVAILRAQGVAETPGALAGAQGPSPATSTPGA
jgi:hypothetical protein